MSAIKWRIQRKKLKICGSLLVANRRSFVKPFPPSAIQTVQVTAKAQCAHSGQEDSLRRIFRKRRLPEEAERDSLVQKLQPMQLDAPKSVISFVPGLSARITFESHKFGSS